MKKILIIEDELNIYELIKFNLETHGFEVDGVQDGGLAIDKILEVLPNLIILDLMLPGKDGISICREIRANNIISYIPIIMLTAKSEEFDKVLGLEIGADDYIAKPFSPREVCARVRTVLRRLQKFAAPPPLLRVGEFTLNDAAARVTWCGQSLNLTRYEFLLLKTLLHSPGRIFSRQLLMEQVWGDANESFDRTVDTHIKTLRAKLREVNPDLSPINTHRGMGYSLGGF